MASRRTRAREMALQMLYQQDLNPDVPVDTVRELIVDRLRDESLSCFAWSLFAGVMESRPALDAKIEAAATNWALNRMAPPTATSCGWGPLSCSILMRPPRWPSTKRWNWRNAMAQPNRRSSSTAFSIS